MCHFAGIVIKPRSLINIGSVKPIVQFVAVVHPVLDAVVKPEFEGKKVLFINDWRQHVDKP